MSSNEPPTNNHCNNHPDKHRGPRPEGEDPTSGTESNIRSLSVVPDLDRPDAESGRGETVSRVARVLGELLEHLARMLGVLLGLLIVSAAFVVAVYIVVALLFTYRGHAHSGHTRGASSAQTVTQPVTAVRAVSAAAVGPAAFHTPTTPAATRAADAAAASERPGVGGHRVTAGRDDCRTERRGGRDRAVIGAGPIEIAIDTRVADCADRARSRDSADREDRDCPCDRDRSGRERSRYRDQDRDPVVYLPADPYSYPGRAYPRDAYPGGYYPREGYRGDDGTGDRPGHVCRRVRPGEHPDLPDGGLICLPADRAPRGW